MGFGVVGGIQDQAAKSRYLSEQKNSMRMVSELSDEKMKDMEPEQKESFLEHILNGEKIYIAPEVIRDFYQTGKEGDKKTNEEKNAEFNDTMKELGVEDQLGEADAIGADLEISKAAWVAKYGNAEIGKALEDDIRFAADGVTGKEAATIKKEAVGKLEEIGKEISESTEDDALSIELADVREEMMKPDERGAIKYSAEDANKSLSLIRANAKIRAKQLGITPAEYVKSLGLTLKSGQEFEGEADFLQKSTSGINLIGGERSHPASENITEVKRRPLVVAQQATESYLGNPTKAVNDAVKFAQGKSYSNENSGQEFNLTPQALAGLVKRIDVRTARPGEIHNKQKIRSDAKKFRADYTAIKNLETLVADAVPIATAKNGNEIYYSVGTTKSLNVALRLEIKDNEIVKMETVSQKFAPGDRAAKVTGEGQIPQRAGDVLSVKEFSRIVNTGRQLNIPEQRFFQKKDLGPRAAVTFKKNETLIELFKTANKSSLLHETGHIFLQEMENMVADGTAPEDMVQDLNALKEFAGGTLDVEGIERIVTGFETYLMEGKAPSVELQSAFASFKQWLTAIYASLKGMTQIDDEVRDVFDRMLASQEEIDEVASFYEAKRSLSDILGSPKAKGDDLKEKKEIAKRTAEEKLLSKLMRAYTKAIGGKQALQSKARKEVDAMPVYIAIDTAIASEGIDSVDLDAAIGKDGIAKLKKIGRKMVHKGPVEYELAVKKNDTYGTIINRRGGIQTSSLSEDQRKELRENKAYSSVKKDGTPLDVMAESLAEENLISVPDDKNPADYLYELIKNKTKIPGEHHTDRMVAKSGISIGELAYEADYATPEQMLNEILGAESKAKAVKRRTDEMITEKEEEILLEIGDRADLAEEEYANTDKMAVIIAEQQLLEDAVAKKEGKRARKVQAELYKQVAKDALYAKPTSKAARYELYHKAEKRYATKAQDLAEKGKLPEALEAKNKQLLNHVMVQEAIKIKELKRKIENKYKTKKISPRLAKTENDYAQIAASMINTFALNSKTMPTEDVPILSEIDGVLVSQLPEWVTGVQAPSGEVDYKKILFSELIELDDAINSVIMAGRDTLLSMKDSELKSISEVVDRSIQSMDKIKSKKIHDEKSTKGKIYGALDSFMADTIMMEYLYEEMDNYKMHREDDFGVMRTMHNRGRAAEGEFKDIQAKKMAEASPHFKLMEKAKERIEAEKGGAMFLIEGAPLPEVMTEAGKNNWSVERMMALLLNTGNTHNLEVVQKSYGFTTDNIQAVSKFFTKEELHAIQGIWDVTNTLFDPLDKVNFNIYNRHLPKVEAEKIELMDNKGNLVVLEGGYYPLQFDRSISDTAEAHQEADMMKDRNKAVLRSSKPTDGMTKTRGRTHSLPPLLSISVWTRHITDTSRYISHAEYLRDMNRITSDDLWKAKAREKVGRQMYSHIRDNLKFQARPERQIHGAWEKFLNTQKGMSTSIILGLNMGVALKQRLSGLSAQTDIGGTWIMKSLREADLKGSLLGLSSSDMWTGVMAKSKYIRARDGQMDREITDTVSNMSPFIKKLNIPGIDKKISWKDAKDAMFFLIQANDRAMTGVVWNAAYMKSLDGNKNELTAEKAEAKAIEYADAMVAMTQPSALPLDLNTLQRSEGMMRLFTSFMTWTFKQGNRFRSQYNAWQAGAMSTKEYSRHVIYEGLMAPWGATIISSMLLDGELPEWWEYMTSPAEYLISWIPLVRDVPGAVKYRKGIGSIPAMEGMNRALHTGVTGYKWLAGDKEYMDLLWSIGRTSEAITGIPALKVVKNMKNTHDIVTGKKKKRK